jgi:hypothetical protein
VWNVDATTAAKSEAAHAASPPFAIRPATSAPWHAAVLWHQPQPGLCAHAAQETASPHASRHSPTASAVSGQALSSARARHRSSDAHHAQASSSPPAHAPHVARAAQWSAHARAHSRTPEPSETAAAVTSVQVTAPVALSYEPISTASTPTPNSHLIETQAPVPGKGPSTAPSGARASHAQRSAAWPLTLSNAKQSSADAELSEHAPTAEVTVGVFGCSNVARVFPALFDRDEPSARSRPAISTPTRPPLASPRAPLTRTRYDTPPASRATTARLVRLLPRLAKDDPVFPPGLKSSSPPVSVASEHAPVSKSQLRPDAGSANVSASAPAPSPRHVFVFGSSAAGCDKGNSSTGDTVARTTCAPSVSHETPTHVSLTAPASARVCSNERVVGGQKPSSVRVRDDVRFARGGRGHERSAETRGATLRAGSATVTRDECARARSMKRTRYEGGRGTRVPSEKTHGGSPRGGWHAGRPPGVAGSYRHRREHREHGHRRGRAPSRDARGTRRSR